jgi:hypothetical protein
MLRPVRWCFLALFGALASCTLAVDTDLLDEGCAQGTKNCDGVCVSTQDTETGCGRVNNCTPCALENADPICAPSGECVIATCSGANEDCDGEPKNGCEVNLDNDPDHCGSCNADPCDLPNVQNQACSRGECAVGKCRAPYKDCNERNDDGCEVDTSSDEDHCGDCGEPCTAGQSCVDGVCE